MKLVTNGRLITRDSENRGYYEHGAVAYEGSKIAAVGEESILRAKYPDAEVIDAFSIKPFDKETLFASVKKTGCVVTCEEHSILGGLGEAVAAVLGEQCPVPMRRVGVKDVFGHSGPAWELLEQFGLRSDAIIAAVKELV